MLIKLGQNVHDYRFDIIFNFRQNTQNAKKAGKTGLFDGF